MPRFVDTIRVALGAAPADPFRCYWAREEAAGGSCRFRLMCPGPKPRYLATIWRETEDARPSFSGWRMFNEPNPNRPWKLAEADRPFSEAADRAAEMLIQKQHWPAIWLPIGHQDEPPPQ